jgi:dCMP deaminase
MKIVKHGDVIQWDQDLSSYAPPSELRTDSEGKKRPSFADTVVCMLAVMARRSTCPDGKRHAAIILVNDQIVSVGYNGPPAGQSPCLTCTLAGDELGKDWRTCPAVHAEVNAVVSAAKRGVSIQSGVMFVTKHPCQICRLMLENCELEEVVYVTGRAT